MTRTRPRYHLRPLELADAGELLTLQRAAFVGEAQLYDDPRLPPLTQTLAELEAEIVNSTGIAATAGTRLVGAVRMRLHMDVLYINRLAVAPDLQGQGIGTALLRAAETSAPAHRASLFTGHLSRANLRLYRRLGYVETRQDRESAAPDLIHLTKDLSPAQ
jgi:ribosomal protein S18 acetylase RimI-like enzyme